MENRWVLESNILYQGVPKYILDETDMSVIFIISGSQIQTIVSIYGEAAEPMIDPGSIIDPQSIILGNTPNMLVSGDLPSGNGTITYQWEERT